MDKKNVILGDMNDDKSYKTKDQEIAEELERLRNHRTRSRKNNPVGFARSKNVGKRHLDCDLDNFDGDTSFLSEWEKERTDNILIHGTNAGTGKTHLAVALLKYIGVNYPVNELDKQYSGRLSSDIEFVFFSELMMKIRSTFKESSSESESDIIKRYSNIPYLIIDDIGAEKNSEYVISVLYLILNNRYQNMLPTIVTTNMDSKGIAESYHQRIVSRLASGFIVKLEGKDRRIDPNKSF